MTYERSQSTQSVLNGHSTKVIIFQMVSIILCMVPRDSHNRQGSKERLKLCNVRGIRLDSSHLSLFSAPVIQKDKQGWQVTWCLRKFFGRERQASQITARKPVRLHSLERRPLSKKGMHTQGLKVDISAFPHGGILVATSGGVSGGHQGYSFGCIQNSTASACPRSIFASNKASTLLRPNRH